MAEFDPLLRRNSPDFNKLNDVDLARTLGDARMDGEAGDAADQWLKGQPDRLEEDAEVDFEALMEDRPPDPDPVAAWLPPWRFRAACRGNDRLMFSEDVEGAKWVCASCPVQEKCLAFAVDNEPTHGVWGGHNFEERTRICPICLGPKAPDALGCDFGHTLLRLGRLGEQQELGDPDVRISIRQRPSARTNPECIVPRGRSHSTSQAYKDGCRCRAALDERMAEHYAHGTRKPGTRGPYKARKPKAS